MNFIFKAVLTIALLLSITTVPAQTKKVSIFGSYSYGWGNITPKVSSSIHPPTSDEINKLRTGKTNQLEVGVLFHSFGLGIIHNSYAVDATTSYDYADLNYDGYFENGILSDNLKLRYTGLEIIYKLSLFKSKFGVNWRGALGIQNYSIDKDINIMGIYPQRNYQHITGNIFTPMLGVEINYQICKILAVGVETSLIPGNYKNMKDKNDTYSTYSDNVSRLNTGMKLIVTL
ncbi:MAG: hypothetical protein Q8928_12845 [Bacteroidota bacterium]|nr:hypothetical protein [Bacteroidota bacterium]